MERNNTNKIPLAPLGILGENKNIGNSLGRSFLQSLAFLFFTLFLSLSLFTGNVGYASNLTGPGVKSLSSQKELRAVWFSYLDWTICRRTVFRLFSSMYIAIPTAMERK